MADASILQRNLAHHWGRAAMAQRMGDEATRREALEAADNCSRLLDVLDAAERAREWDLLAGSPDHG